MAQFVITYKIVDKGTLADLDVTIKTADLAEDMDAKDIKDLAETLMFLDYVRRGKFVITNQDAFIAWAKDEIRRIKVR